MRILMVSAESNPLYKTGGLADVVFSLSKKMTVYKHRVYIALPFYKNMLVDQKKLYLEDKGSFLVKIAGEKKKCHLYACDIDNVTFLLFKNENYFDRDNIYGYNDDNERFAFFQNAVIEFIASFKGGFDIIHVHDWHSSMVPFLFKRKINASFTRNPKFVLTIHNPAFMGYMKVDEAKKYFSLDNIEQYFINENNDISFLKMGIYHADAITTVSPTHAKELINEAKYYNLDDVLLPKECRFFGILNGIDNKEFNPDKDKKIPLTFNKENVISHKIQNKRMLCNKYCLLNPDYPLFGLVSRLTNQKGISLICDAMDEIMKLNVNIIILGKGEKEIENRLKELQEKYPSSLHVIFEYSDYLAHQIYASSDFFLMPSKFEPCGISQMIALRYGTLPLVREVGGLKDTIIPYNGINETIATGFSFYEYSSSALYSTVRFAVELYGKKRAFSKMIHNAMDKDFSWTKSYFEYIDVYQKIMQKK